MVDTTWTFVVIFMAIFGALATFAVLWVHAEHEAHTTRHHGPDARERKRGSGRAAR